MTPIDDLINRLKAVAHNEALNNGDMRGTSPLMREAADALQAMKEALDDLIMAAELPGDHCELEPAIERARRSLKATTPSGSP